MAYFDSTTVLSTAQAITATANSTNVFDVTGAGSGNAPAMIGPNGVNTAMGYDIGSGDGVAKPAVYATVTTAGTGTGTITIGLQAAPDNGSYSPGTYTTLYTSAAIIGSTMALGQTFQFDVPPIIPGEALPRFYRLVYTVSGTLTVSLTADILLNPPSGRIATLYGNNFVAV